MYATIWRHLPGPTPAKALTALLLVTAAVLLLLIVVFPWVVTWLPGQDVSVDMP
jgi:hypothetical protein